MRTRLDGILATAAVLVVAIAAAHAAAPIFWQVATRADFLRGEVDNLSLDSEGRLSLGPATETVFDASAPFLWTLLPGPSGSVFAGSGNDGKVFRIGPDGRASTFYDAPEMEVHALAPAPGGGIYVATSPEGRIYKVDASGAATPFFDPGDKYIWSLAVDAAGNLYAGTGEKGVIYRIGADGEGKPFYTTKATNVVSLVFTPAGDLIASTESPGRVFRVDRNGRASVLLDSELREIRAVRIGSDGAIYVAAVSGGKAPDERPADAGPAGAPRTTPIPTVTTEISGVAIIDPGPQGGAETRSGSARAAPGTMKGAVYRIQPDGLWDTLWQSADDLPYDLNLEAGGGVLVGTGPKGQLFRITGEPPRATLVGRVTAQQVTRFLPAGQAAVFVATANPGKVVRLGPGRAARGTFESEVRDAQTVSTWGTISWKATMPSGTRLEIFTRSGNSQTPDDTWSAWGGPYADPDGSQILSPKARYLQWRAVLAGGDATPVVTSVTVAYLQRNLRPSVSSITVHPPGTVFQKPYSTGELEIAGYDNPAGDTRPASAAGGTPGPVVTQAPALGRRTYQKGLQTLQWKAEDGNDDRLEYDILYRRESDMTWRTLKRGLVDALFVWDTTSVPNGTYVARVVASDAVANPTSLGLTGDLDSATFDIDNTPPAIQITGSRVEGGRTIVTFQVRDDQSVIQRVDFSVGAERWRAVYPLDGICDSRQERFELVLEGDTATGSVVIRAVDAMNNAATARADRDTVAKLPPPGGRRPAATSRKPGREG